MDEEYYFYIYNYGVDEEEASLLTREEMWWEGVPEEDGGRDKILFKRGYL